ncbi:fibronectin type III domain-containing protein, partial [Cellulosimicrobium composti]
DMDGLTAKAFVKVPGLTDQAPTLRPGITPLEVVSGEPLAIDVTDHVLVVEGRTPRLTTEEKVTALEGTREVTSTTEIVYTSDAEYVGPAAVTFEVTDGSGPDDPDGNTALLTIPISVVPPENLPPELSTPTLDVAAGEEATVDLARFATDPDGDALTFAASGGAEGVTVTVEGTTLRAQATPDVPKGSVVQVPITVTDGEHPPVEGAATLTVVASTRPLARANQDTVDDAHQGKPTTVPVLANDSNPFPDTPLEIVGASVETGSGDVSYSGNDVVVTPEQSFVGVMVVVYRIQDATKDPDRMVEGRVQLKVLGKPEAPATPQVLEVRSKTVVLSWDPPNNNGADITGYTVRSQNGYEKACGTTTCTLDGLTNNVEYTFTVFATNAVGDGPASPPSAVARPDEKPDPPAAPTLEFGDQSLTVTWTNKTYTDRSPIQTVNLEISPAPPSGAVQMQALAGTQVVWTGLQNGVAYRVRVQAVNLAPDPSEWGEYSAEEIPAGLPDVPKTPTASRAADSPLNGGSIDVSWAQPFENGDAIKAYHLQRYRNGSPDGAPLTLTGLSHKATGLDNESSYTFTVTAENKAGVTAASPASAAVVPYGRPEAPPRPSVQNVGSSSQDSGIPRVSWGAADANGSPITKYTVTASPGGAKREVSGTSVDFTGLSAGTYTFTVTATNAGGTSTSSPASAQVSAYQKPGTPGVSSSRTGENRGRFTISAPSSNGGNAITRYEWELSGAQNRTGTGQSVDVGSDYDQTYRLRARACNAAGCGAWSGQATFTTDKRPEPPRIWVTRGPQRNTQPGYGNCTGSMCTVFRVNANATFPSGTYTFQCYYDGNRIGSYSWTEHLSAGGYVDLGCILGNPYGTQRTAKVYVTISPSPSGIVVEQRDWPIR